MAMIFALLTLKIDTWASGDNIDSSIQESKYPNI